LVVIYALAMAWVESAVVFYMRSMIRRLDPYQPNPLPLANGFGFAEVGREAATLIMLATVGWLAGRTWRSRVAYALLAFGVWDIGYYVWLVPLTAWPTSLANWDILFLIPLPWWGPVWAPVSIATLMILFGSVVGRWDSPAQPLWPSRWAVVSAAVGGTLALYLFMADALALVTSGGRLPQLRDLLPVWFNWPLFLVALALMALPVIEVVVRVARRRPPAPPLDLEAWQTHFQRNGRQRPEPNWNAPLPRLSGTVLFPLVASLEQFRLGDGGGPAALIAWDAKRFHGRSAGLRSVVDAWFREEAEHARLLGCAVRRWGGREIQSHWSFTAFCGCRRWLGVRFELQVLTLTELVSTAYYRELQRHVPDAPLAAMCALILRDEAGHVAFQRARLRADGCDPWGFWGGVWRAQFWLLGLAAATMLWVNHGPCLTALGSSRQRYFAEVRRQLRRFVVSLASDAGKVRPRQAAEFRVPRPAPQEVPVTADWGSLGAVR
jgi:hypothetical protein